MATLWHQRTLPYPLLAGWTGDYPDCEFGFSGTQATLRNETFIDVKFRIQLTSEYLSDLIDSSDASYVVEVSCPKTFLRQTLPVSPVDSVEVCADDCAEELFLTPQVVSSERLVNFISEEHAPEWHEHRPAGFSVPEAGILAVGNVVRITIEETGVNSVIDLVANSQVDDGIFQVELDGERIKIHVAPNDKERIESLRQHRVRGEAGFSGLYPSLYLSAVSEALRHLNYHQHTRWAFAMRLALEKCGLGGMSGDLIAERSLVYAQHILEQPMSGFLDAATNREEGE